MVRNLNIKRLIVVGVIFAFLGSFLQPSYAQELTLPAPGTMVNLSPAYVPVLIKGLRVHPENPLLFDFILDTGRSGLKINSPEFKEESEKLIKYFLASLTIKEDDLWVNLSPYEKDRIIPDGLGKTEIGRDMLAQDYILKQLTASLIYPEKQLGKEFWNTVYAKAQQEFGTSDIPVNTFNKVWIVADKAKILERNNVGYVVGSHLKVMLEEDYLALLNHTAINQVGNENKTHTVASQVIRKIIIPELEKEVNQGQNFAPLRQMFYSMILATWYKLALKNALLNQVYSNKGKTGGVLSDDPTVKEKIFQQYLKAYKKGVFNYIKEGLDVVNKQPMPRKYFSGGLQVNVGRVLAEERIPSKGDDLGVDGAMAVVETNMNKAVSLDAVMLGGTESKPITPEVVERLKRTTDIVDAMRIVVDYYPEMHWLTGDVNATPEGKVSNEGVSISEKLFGQKHIEFNRTAVGIMTFLWVLNNDYEAFTASQGGATKLTRQSFDELRVYTERILNEDPEAFDALVVYTVINDLGKIKAIVDLVQTKSGIQDIDHDKILTVALENHPELAPSFNRLPDRYKRLIVEGMKAKFNFGQFVQGENVPASLSGLVGLDKEALDFYMLHVLYDIAGAAGHVKEAGSLVVTEPTYQGFKQGIESLGKISAGEGVVAAYDDFLNRKGAVLHLDVNNTTEIAVIRLSAMLRISDVKKSEQVLEVFNALEPNEKAILEKELNLSGVNDGHATLLYYAPAALANLIKALEDAKEADAFKKGLQIGLKVFARTFQLARIALKGRQGNGVFTVDISKLAELAKIPQEFEKVAIDLERVGDDAKVIVSQPSVINVAHFPRVEALSEIPGQKVIPIGIGGGSDVIQAAVLGQLLQNAGKTIPAVISVRTVKIGSQGAVGELGSQRTVENHGGEIVPGVYKILPTTTGSGRFLENLPASQTPVFLVLDSEDGTLTEKIKSVIHYIGGADTVLSVDTGGDALHVTGGTSETSRATPDQDLRVLRALQNVGTPVELPK